MDPRCHRTQLYLLPRQKVSLQTEIIGKMQTQGRLRRTLRTADRLRVRLVPHGSMPPETNKRRQFGRELQIATVYRGGQSQSEDLSRG